tara:strand:+ start:415 stop:783 length:369 start_codon:yes stop_codon:yes gene_type:complete
MRTVTYDEACELVREVKHGERKSVLCIIVAHKDCPFCVELKDNIYPNVKEKYGDDIEFVEFIHHKLLLEDDNFIFPIERSPVSFFYIRKHEHFPTSKVGVGPIDSVMMDVLEMITLNKKLNG